MWVVVIGGAVDERIETTGGIEVDDGYAPHVAGFLDARHVGVEIFSTAVLNALIGLYILVVGVEDSPMDGGEQHNLFGSETVFKHLHGNVDAPAVGLSIVAHRAVATLDERLGFPYGSIYGGVLLVVPLSDLHSMVVVVGAYEDDDGIEVVAMVRQQCLGLTRDVIPLSSADYIFMISGFPLSKNMITFEKLLLFVVIALALQRNSLNLH